jgi:plastocyanin
MLRRFLPLAIIAVVVVATIATGYIYLAPLFPANSSAKPLITMITIPKGSSIEPTGFSSNDFQRNFVSGAYPFPVNITVRIGVNNTIEWVNRDTVSHNVAALVVPPGGLMFNSAFFGEGKTFSVTLTVPGVYRYTCAWHNWLAGQITVNPA